MPLLSNTCVSTGSSKDIILDTVETEPNFSGDRLKYANGIDESLSVGELHCEFEDLYYSPIMIIFFLWIMYMHYVSKAICDPEYNYMVYRIIDYSCSIYVFMLGTDNQTVIRWIKYGGCFPINIPFNAIQHSKEMNNEALRNIGIDFVYNFMCAMDPVTLTEFNILSGPSIYHRLKQNGQKDALRINEFIGGHHLTLAYAAKLLTTYPPKNNSLPKKLIYPMNTSIKTPTGYEDPTGRDTLNPFLINRANGVIINNFYGVPYIAEGNKLMFI
jgi:hypothetical protein